MKKLTQLFLFLISILYSSSTIADKSDDIFVDYVDNSLETLKKDFIKGDSFKEMTEVTTDSLFDDFDSNELAANKKYKNSIIRINGRVDNVQEDIFGSPFISLKSKKAIFGVKLNLENTNDERILDLKKGKSIDMVCYGVSFNVQVPTLKRCQFADEYARKSINLILNNISKNIGGSGDYSFISKAEFFIIAKYQLNKEQITNYCEKNKKCSVLDIGKNIKETDESKNIWKNLAPEQKEKVKTLPMIPNLYKE